MRTKLTPTSALTLALRELIRANVVAALQPDATTVETLDLKEIDFENALYDYVNYRIDNR